LTDGSACHLEHEVLATRGVGRDGFDGQHRESFAVTRWVSGDAIELDPERGAGEATQRAAYDCRSGGESGRAREDREVLQVVGARVRVVAIVRGSPERVLCAAYEIDGQLAVRRERICRDPNSRRGAGHFD